MLDISLINVIIREYVSFGILRNLNTTFVKEDIFIKSLQGGTIAFAHLFLQISDSHIPCEVFLGLILHKE